MLRIFIPFRPLDNSFSNKAFKRYGNKINSMVGKYKFNHWQATLENCPFRL
jgi:hypothetical protein